MKPCLTILLVLIINSSIAQVVENASSNPYKNTPELLLVDPLDSNQIIAVFKLDYWHVGIILDIRPDGTFKRETYGCKGGEPLDSGTWKMSNRQLQLDNRSYDVIRFEHIYYLVPVSDRGKFKKEFIAAVKKARKDTELGLSFVGKVMWKISNEYYRRIVH